MTDIKWGHAIAVDGKRPDWLGDEEPMLAIWSGGTTSRPGGWDAGRLSEDAQWHRLAEIKLPADHPHYRQTEEAPIDWSGELEAVHEDGRVVLVTLQRGPDDDGDMVTNESLDDEDYTTSYWTEDGLPSPNVEAQHMKWRIRNVPQPTPQADTKPDLTARMEALVRRMAVFDAYSRAGASDFRDEARAIVALLPEPEAAQPFDVPRAPCMTISKVREMVAKGEDVVIATMLERGYALPEPVDEDLIEAREIALSHSCPALYSKAGTSYRTRQGDYDDAPYMRAIRKALARGRALALAGEKEA